MKRFIGVLCSQRTWWMAMATVAGVWAAGCSTGELRTVPLTASRTPFVRDVPVPMSFELVDDLSQSYRTQSHRVIRHAYFGQAEPITAYAFYKEQMPRSGWRFLSESNVEGAYQMTFEKGSEVATVQVLRETRGFRAGALVTVRVKPIGVLIGPN